MFVPVLSTTKAWPKRKAICDPAGKLVLKEFSTSARKSPLSKFVFARLDLKTSVVLVEVAVVLVLLLVRVKFCAWVMAVSLHTMGAMGIKILACAAAANTD